MFCGTPDSGSRGVSEPFACSWYSFRPAGLPCSALTGGLCLVLLYPVVPCLVNIHGRPALFWGGDRKGSRSGGKGSWGEVGGVERGEATVRMCCRGKN